MLSFSQPMTPAVKAHLEAQCSLVSELSQKMFETVQKFNELNMQVARTVVQDSLSSAQQVMVAKDPYEALSIASVQAQPAAEKIRAYQQHLTDIAARSQADMAKTAESHLSTTSRTAAAMADEFARTAAEETEKVTQRQKAVMEKLVNPIERPAPDSRSSIVRASAA